jgi:hypothetical protein
MKEQVNHPKHYNSHPAGIECIDIIRHYTCDIANALKYLWRAGLKPEMGKEDADKEIEDLKKALWYIEDYRKKIPQLLLSHFKSRQRMEQIVIEVTGHRIDEIWGDYESNVATAIGHLLVVGIIRQGEVRVSELWELDIREAVKAIQHRILDIETQLTNKELQSTMDVLNGYAVEGEDYVCKPGGVRETEPDKYDPLNMMIIYGRAYCLTDEVRKKDNGALYGPCDNCDLRQECLSGDGTDQIKSLCHLHFATDQQYYREVGYCKYRPYYGTIEVVDEQKELQKELREMESEDEQ